MSSTWTQAEAVTLCAAIEGVAPEYGCHVALTGGLLYKFGPRKDADILFYRIRQVEAIDEVGLFGALAALGLEKVADFGFVKKGLIGGKSVDMFFPEQPAGQAPATGGGYA